MRMWNGLEVAEYVPDWFVNAFADVRILETPQKGQAEDVIGKLLVDNGKEHQNFWRVLESNENLRPSNKGRQCRYDSAVLIVDLLSRPFYRDGDSYKDELECYKKVLKQTKNAENKLRQGCIEILQHQILNHPYPAGSLREVMDVKAKKPKLIAVKTVKLDATMQNLVDDMADFIEVLQYKVDTASTHYDSGHFPPAHRQLIVNAMALLEPLRNETSQRPLAKIRYITELILEKQIYSTQQISDVVDGKALKPL